MTMRERLLQELDQVPEPLIEELHEYLRFMKQEASRERFSTAVASEPALARDWLRPEEGAAWKGL